MNKKYYLINLLLLSTALSGCNNQPTQEKVNITYHFLNGETKVISVDKDGEFELETPTSYDGYNFYHYFSDEDYQVAVPNKYQSFSEDTDIYALYIEDNKIFVNYFNYTSDTEYTVIRDKATNGESYIVKYDVFEKEGYYIYSYSQDKNSQFKNVKPGDSILVTDSLNLFPIWKKEYSGVYNNETYKVRIYDSVGLGSAVMILNGEQKKGFFNSSDNSFDFYFGANDGFVFTEDISGKLTGEETFLFCNMSEKGMYAYKDYLDGTIDSSFILSMDGYGSILYGTLDSLGFKTEFYGTYELSQYGDYVAYEVNPTTGVQTGRYFYFTFEQTSKSTDSFNGTFTLYGEEGGDYFGFNGNSILTDTALSLDGYGHATYYEGFNNADGTYTKSYEGTYKATDKYNGVTGEYIFQSNGKIFKFSLFAIEDNEGIINYVYVLFNSSLEGEYTKSVNDSYPCLYLDGYTSVTYYINESDYLEGSYLINNNELICFFYDSNDNQSIMRFEIDTQNKTFSVNDSGFVIVDGELVTYEGYSSIVEIPNTVTRIGDDAFNYVRTNVDLVEVTIPSSVTSIGERAFENNGTLRYVYFESMTPPTITDTSFRWPGGQFKMVVPEESLDSYKNAPVFSSKYQSYITTQSELDNKPLYEISNGTLISFNPKSKEDSKNIVIPSDVTTINEKVFKNNTDIETLDLGNVEVIGKEAFLGATNLTSLTASKVKEIGDSTFLECYSLNNVELPNIETIGSNAFSACYSLNSVVLGEHIVSIGDFAFSECSQTFENNGEEEVEIQHLFFIEMKASTGPAMGQQVFSGTQVKIKVASIDIALEYYRNGSNWTTYFKHFYIESGDEAGEYIDSTSLLGVKFEGRFELYDMYVFFYKIEGTSVTFYYLDDGILYTDNGTYEDGVLYYSNSTFVRKEGTLTYTNNEETLEIDTNYTRSERNGYDYIYNAKFNGQDIILTAGGNSITGQIGHLIYTFYLEKNNTFTYTTKMGTYTENYTSSDNSNISVTYSGSSVIVKGTLNSIIRSNNTPLSTELGWYVTNVGENSYKFTQQFGSTFYVVTLVLGDSGTFTYSYYTYSNINCLTEGTRNIVSVSVSDTNEILDVKLIFRESDNSLTNVSSTYEKVDDYYLITVDSYDSVYDSLTGSYKNVASKYNGVYKVTFDLTTKTATIEKM